NTKEIAEYLETSEMFKADDFLALTGLPKVDYRENKSLAKPTDYSADYAFLADKPSYRGLEGFLFPDTYRIFVDATADEVIRKMLNNFDAKLTPEMRAEIEKQGKTVYEIVTMASIVQKEVRNEKDMKIVSGIFWNRIKNGQALESCATLAYVLGENKKQYTYEDTRVESPYNCYINRGLPPGPIANPGIKAIEAAIYPEDTNYNYFLSSFETGETIYSRTFEEHVRNKEKYLR
ncbi:MAG: endolytic transglycosylase MltG, partial [Candidatus Magasanikbacteria bacterium]|nr:endolytic transglycosylase MltG [Candidatus Magasanikbacteria bacterium]